MVMTSQQISGIIAGQQAMFGNFASYAQQITPPYGMGAGMGAGAPHSYQPFTGAMMGPPPTPPPMPMQSAWGPNMGPQMMQMATAPPGAYGQQALAERMLGTGFSGLSTIGQGLGMVNMGAGVASMLGIGGAGMAAVGGLPVMAGIMAGQHVAEQGYQGFQQRQDVNRVLRGRFGGQMGVGGGRGGMGFSTEEMGGISQMVREMGTQDLFTNMEELTRVMDRTAGMGMYRGVQSARQFKEKFQQTVDTLREVATTMQTSLEGATEFMESSRRMGFISGQDISRQLQSTRLASAATGMGVGQIQQAMGQGAQMARMWGARGRTGAAAMRNMMSTVSMAQTTGVLSTEDVEFATGGLTGDEGSAALAGRMMETNQRWLQSGAGRVMLAGLWDPQTGGINRGVMARVQSGQITMGQLRQLGRSNIAATGGRQSDFFLREQELRGEAQESAGGQTLFMGEIEQHLQRRGIDFRSPAAQRFVMRRFQVSAPEAQAMLRMHEEAPRLEEEMMVRERQAEDQMTTAAGREGAGIRGLGRRIGRFWEERFQDPFRQAADRLTTGVTKGVEQTVDRLEGRVKMQISRDAEAALQELAEFGAVSTPGLEGSMMTESQLREYSQGLAGRRGQVFGLGTREMTRGVGQMLGMRGEDVASRASALGGWAPGGGLQGVARTDTATIQDWVSRQERMMSRTSAEFGFGADEMKRLGSEVRDLAFDQLSTESKRSAWEKNIRGAGAIGGALSRWKLMEKRGSVQLKAAMTKANTMTEKIALLGELEAAGHVERGFGSGAAQARGGAFAEYEFETMQDIQSERARIYRGLSGGVGGDERADVAAQLADTMYGGGGEGGWQGRSERWSRLTDVAAQRVTAMGELGGKGILGTITRTVAASWSSQLRKAAGTAREGARLAGGMAGETMFGAEDIQSVLEDEEVSGLIRQWKMSKNVEDKRKAQQRLQAISAETKDPVRGDLTKSQRAALGSVLEDSQKSSRVADMLNDLAQAAAAESSVASRAITKERGVALRRRLTELEDWGRDDKSRGAALNELGEVAALREKGDERGAILREREFYAKWGGTETGAQLVGALKEGKGAEYEALGLGRAGRAVTEYMGLGEGSAKLTRRIMEDVMQGAGVEGGLKAAGYTKERDIKQMVMALQGGKEEQVSAVREKLMAAGEGLQGPAAEHYRTRIEKMIERARGGYSQAEVQREVAGAAAGAAEEARLRGAPDEKTANAKLQESQLVQLKTIAMATAKIAGAKNVTAEDIASAVKSATEPTPAANND